MSQSTELSSRRSKLSLAKQALLSQWMQDHKAVTSKEEPIQRVSSKEQKLPLSFAQERLWLLDQLEPGNTAYLIRDDQRLYGLLNLQALDRALRALVLRHETLRTTFHLQGDQLYQAIHPATSFNLPVIDLRGLASSERETVAQQLVDQEAGQPTHLERGPLLRVSLLRLDSEEYLLLLTMHHIISDGWSVRIFERELMLLYRSFADQQPAELAPLPIQYADFASWQRQWLSGALLDQQLAYWKHQLADAAPLELPTDHPRPPVQTFRGAYLPIQFPLALQNELHALCQREGVTPFMVLLASFQLLLARYSGQSDISIGIPIANRTRTELELLIGFFVNTLVMRTDLSGNPTFQALLQRVREVALGAYAHQDVPFEHLVQILQPVRDLSRNPLFQVMLILQNLPTTSTTNQSYQINATPLQARNATAKFDLTLTLSETPQGLKGQLEYNVDLFEAETIARLLAHFQILLQQCLAQPTQPIYALTLMTEQERLHLLQTSNQTDRELPSNTTVHQLIERQVERTPDAIAVRCDDAALSYAQLNSQANQLAHLLVSQGVKPDLPVALLAERSLPFLIAMLAIFKANGTYLPLDPLQPASRLRQMLRQGQCPVLLTTKSCQSVLSQLCESAHDSATPTTICLEPFPTAASVSAHNLPSRSLPHHLAYIIYTSGSTGEPKGVMVEQIGMLNHMAAKMEHIDLKANDIVAQVGPQGFDVSVWQCLAALQRGGTVHIFGDEIAFNPALLLEHVHLHAVTQLQIVPAMLRGMLHEMSATAPTLPALRWVIPTGDALPTELCAQWFGLYPDIPLLNTYGSTECSDDQCHYAISHIPTNEAKLPIAPLGFPIQNMRAYVLDQSMNPVPVGVIGELYIGGIGVGRGYLNDPVRTAQAFLPDPFATQAGARLYRTRDTVRFLANGNIEFLGRNDHLVKIRGHRIELGEIETVLRGHPQITDGLVMVREDTPGEKQLVAYLVTTEPQNLAGNGAAEADLTRHLRTRLQEKLPDYMHPTAFVYLSTLPLSTNGKVDRKALPAPEKSQDLQQHAPITATTPRTPIEELLTTMWQEVLGQAKIGRDENFFLLGGHSLLGTRLISRIRSVFQIELPLRKLFEAPTIAQLTQLVQQHLLGDTAQVIPSLQASPRPPVLPLSFAQQRLWFLDQLHPNTAAYLIRNGYRFSGQLHLASLEQSLSALLQRHETLRTTFEVQGDSPVQVIHPLDRVSLPIIDLQALSAQEREGETQRLFTQEGHRPCNLARGPLWRVSLLRLDAQEHVLFLTMHHIISDGWSMQVLAEELVALYRATLTKQQAPLPTLPIQYADFALWQQQWLQGSTLEAQITYWKKQLAGITPLELPTDHPAPAIRSYRGAAQHFSISPALSQTLNALSRQEGVSLFMTLLATFQVLLYRYTGQTDIVIGTDVANRNQAEVERLIGFFVNQLVLRANLSGNPTFRQFLQQVRHTALDAYAHQDTPFEKLVDALRVEQSLQDAPFFQVKLLLQNTTREAIASQESDLLPDLNVRGLPLATTTVHLDMIVSMLHTPDGIMGVFTYNTDLFEAPTIARMIQHFLTLLEQISLHLDSRIATLEFRTKQEKEHYQMQQKEQKTATFAKFKSIKPKAVSLQSENLIQTEFLPGQDQIPLVIRPARATLDLADWAKNNLPMIESSLLKHGALLFRDFDTPAAADFERFAELLCPDLYRENGEHVQVKDVGSGKLYTPVFYAPDKKLLWHTENSFNHIWPMKILFYCFRPADVGGETPFTDNRVVFQHIHPRIRDQFMQKDIVYVRNYGEGLGLNWQTVFRTSDKAEVEAICKQSAIDFEWKDGDRLRTRQLRPAVAKHPQTGELLWWNQAAHWHPSCLDPAVRESLQSLFAEEDMPRNCYYGDGSLISDADIEAICHAYEEAEVSFPWQKGDILMLDNMLAAHARNPYQGPRKLYVSMGNMITLDDLK